MDRFINEHSIEILNSIPEGIYVIDKEFKIRFVNKAGYEITKKKPEDIIGGLCVSLCKSERCELGCPITEVLRTNKNVVELDTIIQSGLGELIPISLNASILKNENGTPIGGIISFKQTKKSDFDMYLKEVEHFYGIIGKSNEMKNIFKLIKDISNSNATVLITGETGVGKELVVNAIKQTSKRAKETFVKVNCGALPNNILGSELFGHVKGAFTDARNDRIGRFEYADGGTIFLDEITEIPLEMQVQLLRVIQEGTFERIGETKTRKTDVRIIAATNKNLEELIKEGKFREDLYYRLNVLPIEVPSLRERKSDIIFLINYFIKKYSERYGKNLNSVDDETMNIFLNYDWPGNIRELESCIEYSIIRSKRNDYICTCSLPHYLRSNKNCNDKITPKEKEIDEKTHTLLTLLRQNDWNKTKVAHILGIDRSTIHRRLKKIDNQN